MMACGQSGRSGGLPLLIVVPLWLAGCGGAKLGDPGSCRTYASAYTQTPYLSVTSNVICTHAENGGGFDRTCTGGLPTIEHWASRADFIDEAAAVGIIRLATFTNSLFSLTTTYEYDSQRRIQHLLSSPPGVDETFDAWDDRGRPLHRVTTAGLCPGADITIRY